MKKRSIYGLGLILMLVLSLVCGCERYEPAALQKDGVKTVPEEGFFGFGGNRISEEAESGEAGESPAEAQESSPETEAALEIETAPEREPVKVKGIYLGANAVGVSDFMDRVIQRIDETELNAVVIDVKDDYGRITYQM